jgi:hypothetical protein
MNPKQGLAIKPETLALIERLIGFDSVRIGSLRSGARSTP